LPTLTLDAIHGRMNVEAFGVHEVPADADLHCPYCRDSLTGLVAHCNGCNTSLAATATGCHRELIGNVTVRVPLVGKAVEKAVAGDFAKSAARAVEIARSLL